MIRLVTLSEMLDMARFQKKSVALSGT